MFKRLSNLNNLVLGILLFIALATSGLSLILNVVNGVEPTPAWWVSWLQNMSTEMFGAAATFWLINLIFEGRRKHEEKQEVIEDKKAGLIRQMASTLKDKKIQAIEELRAHGWLTDGSLRGINLEATDLREVNLWSANIQEANLKFANLTKQHLEFANLQGTNLAMAFLHGAFLNEANLQDVYFAGDNTFDENTYLPDYSLWTPDTDMRRFTDPTHPNFWRSDNPASPAYRGNTTFE
ncbi:MAG: pentapeptide repeat-containing protein [Anaerolineae bacterium]|nr:pentapeptide repeat-containing protein [Anaerolineae bacterium]